MSLIDYQAVSRLKARLNLVDLCQTGFFFCVSCRRVTEKAGNESCIVCGSHRVKWCPPVFSDADSQPS